MSKTVLEKRTSDVSEEPMLVELELPELFKEHKRFAEKVKEYTAKKDAVRESIQAIVEDAGADVVTYTDPRGGAWKVDLVKSEPTKKLELDLLRDNMRKLGKRDAVLVARIFAKSEVDVPAKEPYIKVFVPKD